SDILVTPDRSRALYALSDPAFARLEEHPYGHFVPGYWPLLSILRFVSPFYAQLSPCTVEQPPLQVLLQLATDSLRDGTATRESVHAQLTELAAHHHWKDLIVIADTAFDVAQLVVSLSVAVDSVASNPTESLAEFIIEQVTEIFVTQLKKDISCARLVESYRHKQVSSTNSALSDFLKVIEGFDVGVEAAEKWPSACSKAAPRLRSRVDGKFRLGKRIAAGIFPMQQMQALLGAGGGQGPTASADLEKKSKLMGYRFYKRTLSTIQQFRKELEPNYASNLRRQLIEARADPARFTALEELAISEYITYPRPEPVVPCSLEDLQPLLDYLRQDGAVAEQTAFSKGTLTVDGRLDLCKQVVGPQGIEPLLMAMMSTSQVKRLLLGNNIVGDGGAEAIARFIEERKDSPLVCWYIAGNEIGPHGFERVCQALAHDTKVNSLWLKRNPLSPAGMVPLRAMLAINQTISVIDLVNCGLLDEGVANLLPALMGPGRNRSLRHLYLGTNGITEKSAPLIAEFVQDHCELESFYLSLNRLGDKGVAIIARALQRNRCLRRISFASNRIGPEGALALCESLRHHPTIELLDLGFTKATVAVSELGNLIGDRGAYYVSELLKSNDKLVALDLLHNSISQVGVNHIIDGLRSNQSLVLLQLTQFGKVHNEPGKEEIKALLSRNFNALTEDQRKHAQLVEIPPHISEIYSVYRTHLG
ncbi:MAG: hypothetical protein Q8P67_04985, partial [archaeon]|nr:hypothetical protein [archaeon]